MEIIDLLKTGKIPEVPFTHKVEDASILKLCAAVIVTAVVIMMLKSIIKN